VPGRATGDAGETFVEVLIALVISGLAIAAFVTGLAASSRAAGLHRSESDAPTFLVKGAEQVKAADYATTCTQNAYASAVTGAVPTSWSLTVAISYWDPTAGTFGSACLDGTISQATVGAVSTVSGLSTITATAPTTPLTASMVGKQVRFTSGADVGQFQPISSVDTAAKTVTTPAFPADPAIGDAFVIEHRTANQMQRVTLSATSADGVTDSLSVIKRRLA
jgi:type II secretory pathway pseudopilin PulG